MCARYRLVRNPDPTGEHKKQALHPRVVPYGTVRINDLMYQVESRSGLSAGDVKGVLQTLADVMADKLEEGYIVELEGIGFFSISLSSRPVMDKSEIRSESIHFRNVNFRCGKYLKKLKRWSRTFRNQIRLSVFETAPPPDKHLKPIIYHMRRYRNCGC